MNNKCKTCLGFGWLGETNNQHTCPDCRGLGTDKTCARCQGYGWLDAIGPHEDESYITSDGTGKTS